MLREDQAISSKFKQWFSDDYFDLAVWFNEQGSISGFQLCYDKLGMERAFTWTEENGTSHNRVDSGEDSPLKNMSPVLVADGIIPYDELLRQFLVRAKNMDPRIARVIERKLRDWLPG